MEQPPRNMCRRSSYEALTERVRLSRVDLAEVVRGLSSAEAEAIVNLMEDHTYGSGTCIFNLGDEQQGLYLVKKGLVEEFRLTEDGNKLPMNRSGPGKFLAVASVEGRYCCFAEAVEDSIVGFLSFPKIEELCRKFPKAAVNLVEVLVRRVGEIEERLQLLALSGLRARVGGTLLGLYATQGLRLERVTHEALAAWGDLDRKECDHSLLPSCIRQAQGQCRPHVDSPAAASLNREDGPETARVGAVAPGTRRPQVPVLALNIVGL